MRRSLFYNSLVDLGESLDVTRCFGAGLHFRFPVTPKTEIDCNVPTGNGCACEMVNVDIWLCSEIRFVSVINLIF